MPIPNQTIGKLFNYPDANLEKEFAQIYDFLQHAKYPRDSIDGSALKLGSVPENRLRPPISSDVAPGTLGELVALGGGSTATLGTVGGSGPTTAAQAQWMELDINGTTVWVPVWI